jgi:hypothetical protein
VKPSEIEPATFRLVAQCLNQLCHQQRASPRLILSSNEANQIKNKSYYNKFIIHLTYFNPEDGDGFTSRNVEKTSHLDAAVCPRKSN